jgi:para-nitrobenzyl esterase
VEPIVATNRGKVSGRQVDGVTEFLGIPYAAAPVGPALFQLPVHHPGWDGVRAATAFGPTPPKPGYAAPYDRILHDPVIPGEEILNLNVWTPEPGGSGLPVMVWIHGGAYRNGSSAVPNYSGRAFARDGVVLVSVNYRLGAPGFALLDDGQANLGLLDQLAALGWVQENIAAFGGDPGNVTIFGESAGAMSVTALLSIAAKNGLFGKVIAQSGAGHTVAEADDARKITRELAARLGVAATAAGFAEVDVPRLIAAQQAVALEATANPDPERWGASIVAAGMAFLPVVDGEVMVRRPIDAIATGSGAGIPVLTGTTTEEYRFFLTPTGAIDAITPEVVAGMLAARGWEPAIANAYAANRPGASAGDVLSAIITDTYFRIPAIRLAEARPADPTFLYEFTWRSPVYRLGACHALELGFVFDTLGEPAGNWLAGDDTPQQLADTMHAAWVSFARTGDPGWPAYTADARAVRAFGDPDGGLLDDPRRAERVPWQGLV